MKILGPFQNCSSIDARGDAFVVARPGEAFLTDRGEVSLPPGVPWGVMYVKLSPNKVTFTGQSHDKSPTVMETWNGTKWASLETGLTGRGVWLDADTYVDEWPAGFQYVEEGTNRPVPRNEVYAVKNGLNESTYLGGLQIGQVNDGVGIGDALGVFDGTTLRLIRSGYAILVNAYREGENVTISFVDNQKQGWIIQTTLGELKNLPVVAPVVVPLPTPPPPKENPMSVPDMTAIIEPIRAAYPTPVGAKFDSFLIEVAKATGGYLYRDDQDILIPELGFKVAADILIFPAEKVWVDFLEDAEGTAKVRWQAHENAENPDRFVDVRGLRNGPSVPDPKPDPKPVPNPPVTITLADVERLIQKALIPYEHMIADLQSDMNAFQADVEEMVADVEEMLTKPRTIQTSRSLGHSHTVVV